MGVYTPARSAGKADRRLRKRDGDRLRGLQGPIAGAVSEGILPRCPWIGGVGKGTVGREGNRPLTGIAGLLGGQRSPVGVGVIGQDPIGRRYGQRLVAPGGVVSIRLRHRCVVYAADFTVTVTGPDCSDPSLTR